MPRPASPLGLLLSALALALVATAGCADARSTGAPAPMTLHALQVGDVPARVRIAGTPEERRRGLMGVDALADDEGMLFVYRVPAQRSIWMRDCHVALDIAFADADGRILQTTTLRPPAQTGGRVERVRSDDPAVFVLEMPAGFFTRHGIRPGQSIRMGGEVSSLVRALRGG